MKLIKLLFLSCAIVSLAFMIYAGYEVVNDLQNCNISQKITPAADTADVGKHGSGLYIPETAEGNKIMLTSAALPTASDVGTSYILTATLEGSSTAPENYIWELSSPNMSEYLTLEVQEPLKCKVTCLKPFGKIVRVAIKNKNDTSINAYVTLHYVKRLESISFTNFNAGGFGLGSDLHVDINATYGVGTDQGEIKITRSSTELSDEFYNDIMNPQTPAGKLYANATEVGLKQKGGGMNLGTFLTGKANNDHLASIEWIRQAMVEESKTTENNLRALIEYEYTFTDVYKTTGSAYSDWGTISSNFALVK